jgi:hypothetical protein
LQRLLPESQQQWRPNTHSAGTHLPTSSHVSCTQLIRNSLLHCRAQSCLLLHLQSP